MPAGAAQVPSANSQTGREAGRAGRGTRGLARWRRGPAELHAAESRSFGAVRPGPGPRDQAQLQSLCLAQRSGRPVPRRPLRALLSLSMPKVPPRCPERALPSGDFASCRAQSGLDIHAVPGGAQGTGPRQQRARQPASQRAASPASLAPQPYSQCAAGAAVLKGPVCSLCAKLARG